MTDLDSRLELTRIVLAAEPTTQNSSQQTPRCSNRCYRHCSRYRYRYRLGQQRWPSCPPPTITSLLLYSPSFSLFRALRLVLLLTFSVLLPGLISSRWSFCEEFRRRQSWSRTPPLGRIVRYRSLKARWTVQFSMRLPPVRNIASYTLKPLNQPVVRSETRLSMLS